MSEQKPFCIGLFGIGLNTYWDQFEGLKEKLEGYLEIVKETVENTGVEVVCPGLVDKPEKAVEAGYFFREKNVDMIFIHITTYALSSTVLPVVRRCGVPVIVLNLVPDLSIDYTRFNKLENRKDMTGEWLGSCSPCPAPEIANVFNRAGIKFNQISGSLIDDPIVWEELNDWLEAGQVAHQMSHNNLGLMGHYYGGMLDVYSDLTLHLATFGGHIEMIEVDELTVLRRNINPDDINERVRSFKKDFDVQSDCSEDDLKEAAKTSLAIDKLVSHYKLGSLAYYYKGSGTDNEITVSSIILGSSRLTARGIPVAGEYEVKNAQAMKILECFGAGGSFTEYYALDLKDDVILMGHDGPGHPQLSSGKVKVKPLEVYHGKVGRGLSVEMSVISGSVTLLSVIEDEGEIILLVAEGETISGEILEIGNTNSRYKFPIGARNFMDQWNSYGPAHHCAVGLGHIASKIEKFGSLLGIDVIQVC